MLCPTSCTDLRSLECHPPTDPPACDGRATSGDRAPAPPPGAGCRVDRRTKQSTGGGGSEGLSLEPSRWLRGHRAQHATWSSPCTAVGLATPTAPQPRPKPQCVWFCSWSPRPPCRLLSPLKAHQREAGQQAQAVAPHGWDPIRHTRLRLSMVRGALNHRGTGRDPHASPQRDSAGQTPARTATTPGGPKRDRPVTGKPTLPPETGGRLTPGTSPQNGHTQDGYTHWTDARRTDAPRTDTHWTDAHRTDAPRMEAPETDTHWTDARRTDAPRTDAHRQSPLGLSGVAEDLQVVRKDGRLDSIESSIVNVDYVQIFYFCHQSLGFPH